MNPAIAISTSVSTVWATTPTSYSTGPLTVFVVSAPLSLARYAYETAYSALDGRLALGTTT